MSRSVLLQLARDSIQEVLLAQRVIKEDVMLDLYPLLGETIQITVNLYLDHKLRGMYFGEATNSLFYNIVIGSKKAAFEDVQFSPLTTSEYLSCEVELILNTEDGIISEKDSAILEE